MYTLMMMMTMNPADIALEDLAKAKSSVAISSAHHHGHHHHYHHNQHEPIKEGPYQ